uniref:Tumor necrosis factor receptor superfamily member 6 n=1 Tax=Accipiter nisus TaxID=211598 RepID=A0A8B9NIK6_9AVES
VARNVNVVTDGFCPKGVANLNSCFSVCTGFVKNTSCPTDVSKHCVPCKNGKEYTDHVNDLDKCLRCYSCDSVFGLEVAKNCTPAQNTECTCAKDYFCNSSVPFYAFILKYEIFNIVCSHTFFQTFIKREANPIIIFVHVFCRCKSGVIEKQCTSTSDTVCGMKDVDLSSHVAGIVEEMTLQEVKTFVRNHKVPEPVIDQTVRDYFSDTSEQKIKLFQVWYQRHGIKGAYGTLINSLRDFKMCTAADKIEEKLKAAVSKKVYSICMVLHYLINVVLCIP